MVLMGLFLSLYVVVLLFHLPFFQYILFNFFLMFIYFWDRERAWTGKGSERGRHRIWSRLQALSCQHRARRKAWTHQLWDHDLSWSWMLNRLSHPSAPGLHSFWWEISYWFYQESLLMMSHFSVLSYSPFIFVFWWFDYDVSKCGLFEFALFGVCWASWICIVMFSINLGEFFVIILHYYFFPPLCLSGTHMMCVLIYSKVYYSFLRVC